MFCPLQDMVMIMKQIIVFILVGCFVLFSGCQLNPFPSEKTETEPTFMDAPWQDATDAPHTEPTTAGTIPAPEERSDETPSTRAVFTESSEAATESTRSNAPEDPVMPPAQANPTVPQTEESTSAAESTESQTTLPSQPAPPPTEPPETQPAAIIPETTESVATEMPDTEPSETEPPATESPETEPIAIEPEAEVIDIAALESYGRSYASSTYGYNGTSACNPDTGAGYFPAATKKILSMEDGYSYVRQVIDSQYKRDMAYGYLPYEEIEGRTVRCPINVSIASAGDNTYTITVYYGGTA